MDHSKGQPAEAQAGDVQPGDSCPQCGGSGVLRTHAAAYRTCLTCVGQGVLPQFESAGLLPVLARWQRQRWSRGFRGDLSAWTSDAR